MITCTKLRESLALWALHRLWENRREVVSILTVLHFCHEEYSSTTLSTHPNPLSREQPRREGKRKAINRERRIRGGRAMDKVSFQEAPLSVISIHDWVLRSTIRAHWGYHPLWSWAIFILEKVWVSLLANLQKMRPFGCHGLHCTSPACLCSRGRNSAELIFTSEPGISLVKKQLLNFVEGNCDNQWLWQGCVLFRIIQISLTQPGSFLFKYHNSTVFLKHDK